MIMPQEDNVLLHVIECPVCQDFYAEQTGEIRVSCAVLHSPGQCCHFGDKQLNKSQVDKLLETVQQDGNEKVSD